MRLLLSSDANFDAEFREIVDSRRESEGDVAAEVRDILAAVKSQGDAALVELTRRFDGHALDEDDDWKIGAEQCRAAYEALDKQLREALDLAAARIRAFHEEQMPQNRDYTDEAGVRLGAIWRSVDAAGLYVPGGRAAYPSSLLMNAIPARVAGVDRVVITTPTPKGQCNKLVLAAAHIAGVDEIWRIGGAQAVGALAYGTDRIGPVDVITGPGNAYVAEAKRQLFGVVGIDMVAGPSEILVIADRDNDPEWIAADLLSQAEHDPEAQAILITDDADFARRVAEQAERLFATLATGESARQSWEKHAVMIVVRDWDEAARLTNALAAEHVELALAEPEHMLSKIRHAGSIFLGRMTPEAIGDYIAGPNHVLPTGRRARFASGLSVLDFMKRTSFIGLDAQAMHRLGPSAAALAHAEGLPAHARSVELRLKQG